MDLNSNNKTDLTEMSLKAIILGIILAVILAGANAYLGMFAGMTVSATIPASIISMGVLSLLFKKHTIFENTQVMTCASAGEALAAGAIFTIPALVIMGADGWEDGFNYWRVVMITGFGGLLGVLFTIPLRRALIVEGDLQFPEGIATAEVLKTGQRGGSAIKVIFFAAIGGALYKIGAAGLYLWQEVFEVAISFKVGAKTTLAYFGSNLSPALLAVGFIVGLNIAVLIFIGGAANWMVTIPICAMNDIEVLDGNGEVIDQAMIDVEVLDANGEVDDALTITSLEYAKGIWAQYTRYVGVGAMVLGGLWAIIKMWKNIVAGVKSGLNAYKGGSSAKVKIPRTEMDIPMNWVLGLMIFSVVPLFLVYNSAVEDIKVSIPMAVMMLGFGFVFSAVAGYMAGLVGSSNNPISGVTVATVLLSSLLLYFLMDQAAGEKYGPQAAVIIGAVICCAASIAGDNLQDLKSGYLVKATPWKQEVMLMIGVVVSAFVLAPILNLLLHAYGFEGHASATTKALSLPQANLMEAVATGVFKGGLPWPFFFGGVAMAIGLIILDEILRVKGSTFRTPVLAVAIGFYLPFQLSVPILFGGLLKMAVDRYQKQKQMNKEQQGNAERTGLLFASGLITGEALIGILLAIPIILMKDVRALALVSKETSEKWGTWMAVPGVILMLGIIIWFYFTGREAQEER